MHRNILDFPPMVVIKTKYLYIYFFKWKKNDFNSLQCLAAPCFLGDHFTISAHALKFLCSVQFNLH